MFRFRHIEEDSSHSQYILRKNSSSHIHYFRPLYNTRQRCHYCSNAPDAQST